MNDTINWDELSELERIKYESNYLRGTLVESLADPITGSIAYADTQLSRFHGLYNSSTVIWKKNANARNWNRPILS